MFEIAHLKFVAITKYIGPILGIELSLIYKFTTLKFRHFQCLKCDLGTIMLMNMLTGNLLFEEVFTHFRYDFSHKEIHSFIPPPYSKITPNGVHSWVNVKLSLEEY